MFVMRSAIYRNEEESHDYLLEVGDGGRGLTCTREDALRFISFDDAVAEQRTFERLLKGTYPGREEPDIEITRL